jgi:hypothetical protein
MLKSFLGSTNWDAVIKAVGVVVALAAAYTQAKSLRPMSRGALKSDLEILKLLDTSDPKYKLIKSNIDSRIDRIYGPAPVKDLPTMLLGALWALGFSFWTFFLVKDHFTWWSLLTGYQALAGLWFVQSGFRGRGLWPTQGQRKNSSDTGRD